MLKTLRMIACSSLLACSAPGASPEDGAPAPLTATTILDLALGTEDSVIIGRLADATRLPDGRIVALDAEADQLIFLDSLGNTLQRAGRNGAGPGEFDIPGWIEQCAADSLFVWDRGLARMAVFTQHGDFIRQFTLPVGEPFRLVCNRRGALAAFEASAFPNGPPTPGEIPMLRGHVVVFNTDGDSVGALPDRPVGQNRVLGPLAVLAMGREELVTGISDSARLWRHDFQGQPRDSSPFPLPARPLSDSVYNAELDRMASSTGATGETHRRVREMLARSPKPAQFPLYQGLLLAEDETAWLITSAPIDTLTALLGRTADGHFLSLTLPAPFEVFEIGSDYLLGKGTDENGGERLVLYRLSREALARR
jgi:hypothetical protein